MFPPLQLKISRAALVFENRLLVQLPKQAIGTTGILHTCLGNIAISCGLLNMVLVSFISESLYV